MRILLQVISWVALVLFVFVPPVLFLAGEMDLSAEAAKEAGRSAYFSVQSIMLVGTVIWFAVTPFWMEREKEA